MIPNVFGITGGLGTGKSSLAKSLQHTNSDIVIIEVDDIRRYALWASIEPSHIQLRLRLAQIFQLNTTSQYHWLDRKIFTELIFQNKDNLNLYSSIATPILQDDIKQKITNKDTTYLLCWAYLLEENYVPLINKGIIITTCSNEINEQRGNYNDDIKSRRLLEPILEDRLSLLKNIPYFI